MTEHGFRLVEDRSDTVLPALVSACPSFEATWRAHLAESGDGNRGLYVDINVFAQHLVALLDHDQTSEFPAVFAAVERLLRDDDVGVRELLKVGLIEDLQALAADRGGSPLAARFRTWLGPRTVLDWDDVHRFWGTSDRTGPDDIP